MKTKNKNLSEIPPVHLSKNSDGWVLIKNGMPLCAVTTRQNAEKLAAQFKIVIPNFYWDGDQGEFVYEH